MKSKNYGSCPKHNLPILFGWPLFHCDTCRNETVKGVIRKIDPRPKIFEKHDIVSCFGNNWTIEKINWDTKEVWLKNYEYNPVDMRALKFVSRTPIHKRAWKKTKNTTFKVLTKIVG